MSETTTSIPPRPGRSTALCHKVAMAMARVLAAKDCIGRTQQDISAAAESIAKTGMTENGYEIAQRMGIDSYYGALAVNILDYYECVVEVAVVQAQQDWADRYYPAPPFPVGSKIIFPFLGESYSGTITGISEERAATYLIQSDPDHARLSGKLDDYTYVVKFEDVTPAAGKVAA